MDEPPKRSPKPYLHVRSVQGNLFAEAIAITGSAGALLKLRTQIDRALKDEDSYPFEEGVYLDVDGTVFEVAVRRARSKSEMREPASPGATEPERTVEELPWAERARRTKEEGR